MAQELRLTQFKFRNAHDLTESGQNSTVKHIALLFLALERNFKRDFYMLLETAVNAKIKTVKHSGQRLFNDYPEAVAVKAVEKTGGFAVLRVACDGDPFSGFETVLKIVNNIGKIPEVSRSAEKFGQSPI